MTYDGSALEQAEDRIRVLVDVAPGAAHALRHVLDGGPIDVLEALLTAVGVDDHVASIGTALTRRRAAGWALSCEPEESELGIRHLTRALADVLEKANR